MHENLQKFYIFVGLRGCFRGKFGQKITTVVAYNNCHVITDVAYNRNYVTTDVAYNNRSGGGGGNGGEVGRKTEAKMASKY